MEGVAGAAGMDAFAVPGAGVRAPKTPPRRVPRRLRNPQQSPVQVHVFPAGKRRSEPKPPSYPPPKRTAAQSHGHWDGKRPMPPSQPPPAKLLQHSRRRDLGPQPPREPPPARLLGAAAARGSPVTGLSFPAAPPALSSMSWPKVWVVGHIHCPMAPPACVQQSAPRPCVQQPPQSQHVFMQAEAQAGPPRQRLPLLRPKSQVPKPCHGQTCADPVPSAKKSAGAPPFVDFQGLRDSPWKVSGAQPVSPFNVFNRRHIEGNAVAVAANGSADEAVVEAIQGTCAGETASRRQRRKRKVEAQPKAAAKLSSTAKSDVNSKSKAFLWESKWGGERRWRGLWRGG